MARKQKNMNEDTEDISTEAVTEQEDCTQGSVVDYSPLVEAARGMIEKYKEGHTINGYDDYRYPGLKALAEALDGLQ